MKPASIFLFLIALGLTSGLAISQGLSNKTIEDPSDAVKAAGVTSVTPLNLAGINPAAFESLAFQKDDIKNVKGRKINQSVINESASRNEIPGQPASLKSWSNGTIDIADDVTGDKNYSKDNNIGKIKTSKDWSHNPSIVYLNTSLKKEDSGNKDNSTINTTKTINSTK